MNKSALQDIQQALNTIRGELERSDDATKWAALELMLATSTSVVALAKKMTEPKTRTVTRTVSIPQTKVVRQTSDKDTTPKATDEKDFAPIKPQPTVRNVRTASPPK